MNQKTINRPLTIGKVANMAGVGVETIRFYERKGLLPKPARSLSGYRLYDQNALKTISFIKRAKELGLSLNEVKELLFLPKEGSCQRVLQKVKRKIEDLEKRIKDLRRIKESLENLANSCQKNRTEKPCPILSALEDHET
ncbi:MerR family transcriptional regulator [Methylacidiphilum sp. Yel]|jgi:Hg(II)-responsive transcriptional regulator|uniref:MerR family transcriptional regulator n=1 Tax=Methylacidiphilum sp. Yel TaxID=1847730 RepID=UPI00106C063A|nr:MerR family transcriptional regulator [Methylacidiphilum sp. Yel]TFE68837.1 MerR family transcriptional regulator [Methylacidiphilum sp. Yel]